MQVKLKCVYQLEMEVYGQVVSVPTLKPGQCDQLIPGSNVIKHLIRQFKQTPSYWRVMSKPETTDDLANDLLLNMLSGVNRWKGSVIPDIIDTAKLTQDVTLLPHHELLVWGRLPVNVTVSVFLKVVLYSLTLHILTQEGHGLGGLWQRCLETDGYQSRLSI